MREILFKAKRTDTDTWTEGNLLAFDSRRYIINDTESIYHCPQCDREEMREMWFAVIPETVSQFTGLFDVNGKRIFEGDIIEYEKRRLIVCFDYGSFGYLEETTIGDKRYSAVIPFNDYEGGISIDVEYQTFYKIIGNRFDNPELLKGK